MTEHCRHQVANLPLPREHCFTKWSLEKIALNLNGEVNYRELARRPWLPQDRIDINANL